MLSKLIKDQDNFGHIININFDKNGSSHKTSIGGCLSMVIKLTMGYYIYTRLYMMFLHLNDDCFTYIDVIENIDTHQDYKDVDYLHQTNLTIFHNIYH